MTKDTFEKAAKLFNTKAGLEVYKNYAKQEYVQNLPGWLLDIACAAVLERVNRELEKVQAEIDSL